MEKIKLFDDDEDDDQIFEDQLNIKESSLHEDPRKTSKLIQLKSRLAHDPRFQVDERFIEDDDDEEQEEECEKNQAKSEIHLEKEKNLQILEKILHKPIVNPERQNKPPIRLFAPRYDPTKEETSIYEEDHNQRKKRKLPNIDMESIDRKLELEKLKAQEEKAKTLRLDKTYYEVETDLKDLFGGKTEDFTLGFGGAEEADQSPEEPVIPIETKIEKQRHVPQNWFGNEKIENEQMETEEDAMDRIRIVLPDSERSEKFKFFFHDLDDPRLNSQENQFYSEQLVRNAIENGKQRQLMTIRALSLRKRSAKKNRRTEEKYTMKQKIRKKFVVTSSKRRKLKLKHARFNMRKSRKSRTSNVQNKK